MTMSKERKQTRGSFEKKHERLLERMAYATLFNITLAVLLDSILLMLNQEADMLFPFKILIAMGFSYLLANTFSSVYYHYKEKRFRNPQSLCLKIVSGIASVLTMAYALPSALNLRSSLSLNYSFEPSIILAFIVGILAASVGLILAVRRMK